MATDNNNQNENQYTGIMSNYKDKTTVDSDPKLSLEDGFDNQIEASQSEQNPPQEQVVVTPPPQEEVQDNTPVEEPVSTPVEETPVQEEVVTPPTEENITQPEESVTENQPQEAVDTIETPVVEAPQINQELPKVEETISTPEPELNLPVNEVTSTNIEAPVLNPLEVAPSFDLPIENQSNTEVNNLEQLLKNGRPLDSIATENTAPVISSTEMKPKHSIFRTIFLIALLIFLAVGSTVVVYLLKSNKVSQPKKIVPTTIDETVDQEAPISTKCQLNDKAYNVGESFLAADACNTCTCNADATISCTEKACITPTPITSIQSTTSAKPATTSAAKVTVTPTKTSTSSSTTPEILENVTIN